MRPFRRGGVILGRESKLFNRLRRHFRAARIAIGLPDSGLALIPRFARPSPASGRRGAIFGRELRLFNRLRRHFRAARIAIGLPDSGLALVPPRRIKSGGRARRGERAPFSGAKRGFSSACGAIPGRARRASGLSADAAGRSVTTCSTGRRSATDMAGKAAGGASLRPLDRSAKNFAGGAGSTERDT